MTGLSDQFPDQFDHRFIRQLTGGIGTGHFGVGVLDALVEGINEHRRQHEQDPPFRSLGPALLGAFLWVDDDSLIEAIAGYPAACVVVSKQPAVTDKRRRSKQVTFDRLNQVCGDGNGFPAAALPGLGDLAPRNDGRRLVVGPGTALPELTLPAFRSIGFRRTGDHLVPILHTKMLLLGHLWWHDEGAAGSVEDVVGFTPQRLWLGSANGTVASRRSLEFGVWLTDPGLMAAAQRFLAEVIGHSEDIDPVTDMLTPEFAPYEFDDEAMAEAATELWVEDADL